MKWEEFKNKIDKYINDHGYPIDVEIGYLSVDTAENIKNLCVYYSPLDKELIITDYD